MRCRNCGYENDLGNSKCIMCDSPLSGPIVDDDRSLNGDYDSGMLKGTVRENVAFFANEDNHMGVCSKCNYPYNPEMGACPNCGYDANNNRNNDNWVNRKEPVINTHEQESLIKCSFCEEMVPSKFKFCANCGKPFTMGTVNPWARPQQIEETVKCTLTPIAWENEIYDSSDIQYNGDSILLNRDNTDPNNSSITSKVQAILTYEDESWYVEDKSQMKTTYKYISRKTQLEDGDILLLGNRRFIFNKK